MSRARFLFWRGLWTIVALWLVLSGAFFLFAFTSDPQIPFIRWGAPPEHQQEAVQAYIESRNYDEPVLKRYAKWMYNYATFQWGQSYAYGKPVSAVFAKRMPVTLTYLLPAFCLSMPLGIGFGVYAATHQHSIPDRLGTSLAYAGLGLPIIFLGPALGALVFDHLGWTVMSIDERYPLYSKKNIGVFLLPTVVMTLQLTGVQVRHTRVEALEFIRADFVKTIRAGGARRSDVARHILRNASLSLASLFVSESLAILFISIIVVEAVFPVPGLGTATLTAIKDRDIGLILATTLLPVVIGIVGNLVQDILSVLIDPRIAEE